MTSTPLAVVGCGFTTGNAADVVSGHVLAMFAPSFFTGSLDRPLRRPSGSSRSASSILAGAGAVGALRRDPRPLLGGAGPARARLELRLHRRDRDARRRPHARGARPGAGHERLRGLRPRLPRLAGLGRADELLGRRPGRRLDRGQPRDGAAPRGRRRPPCLARARPPRPPRALPAAAERRARAARRGRGHRSRRRAAASPGRPPPAASMRAGLPARRAAPAPTDAGTRSRCARARASAASPSRASAATSRPGRQRVAPAGPRAPAARAAAPRSRRRGRSRAPPAAPRPRRRGCRAASSIRWPAVWST